MLRTFSSRHAELVHCQTFPFPSHALHGLSKLPTPSHGTHWTSVVCVKPNIFPEPEHTGHRYLPLPSQASQVCKVFRDCRAQSKRPFPSQTRLSQSVSTMELVKSYRRFRSCIPKPLAAQTARRLSRDGPTKTGTNSRCFIPSIIVVEKQAACRVERTRCDGT